MNPLLLLLAASALAQEPAPRPLSPDDAALLDALLDLLSDEQAAAGADALGLLADPRSLWVLRHSVVYRPPAIAARAALALGAFPQAATDLAGWVRTPTLADEVRLGAARSLARQGAPQGAEAIVATMGERNTSEALRTALGQVLAERWPERVEEASRQVRQDGTVLLMLGTATGTGYALGATGHFGQSGLEAIGALTGAAGGATLGFVWGRTRPVEAGKAAWFSATGIGGLATGTLAGAAVDPGGADSPWVGGLAGGAVGYGVGLLGWKGWQGSASDVLLASGVGLTGGALLSSGASVLRANGSSRTPPTIDPGLAGMSLGLGLGLAAGHLSAPHMVLDGRDAALGIAGTAYGAFMGLALPLGGAKRSVLPVTTASGMALLGYGLGPVLAVPTDVTGGAGGGLVFGAAIGGGTGMLLEPGGDDDVERAAVAAGGTGGAVLGGLLAHGRPGGLRLDDAVLTGLSTSWATWQTVGWARVTEPDPDLAGLLVLAPATAGAATAIASPLLRVDFGDSLCATSLGLWGAYLGSVGGTLADAGSDTTLMLALGASDAGLLAGALLMSPLVDASPVVVGVADAGGVLGGSTAALVTALFTDQADPILIASLVGAGGGATGGALLGRALEGRAPGSAALVLPGWPEGLALSPAWLPHDQGGSWGLRADLAGW